MARTGNTELRQRVVDEIKRGIVLGTLAPGQRIIEAEVTAALAVSRPTVREALNQLARDGYLVQEAYRGHRVARVDACRLREFARLRVLLDCEAASMITEEPSGAAMARLDAVWEVYRAQAENPDPLVRHESHLAFHRGYWEAAGNSFLLTMWPVVEAEMTLSLALDQRRRHDSARTLAVHREVVEATRVRDMARVRRAFDAHTMDSVRALSRDLEIEAGAAADAGAEAEAGTEAGTDTETGGTHPLT